MSVHTTVQFIRSGSETRTRLPDSPNEPWALSSLDQYPSSSSLLSPLNPPWSLHQTPFLPSAPAPGPDSQNLTFALASPSFRPSVRVLPPVSSADPRLRHWPNLGPVLWTIWNFRTTSGLLLIQGTDQPSSRVFHDVTPGWRILTLFPKDPPSTQYAKDPPSTQLLVVSHCWSLPYSIEQNWTS
ncbi:hypothetical protein B0H14DRAFT_2555254 [Mycena olivaceomarginata]|nr:hypothetical protein B0H14DRAFT_2555254 [Mycena olivaceomarginata]